MTGREAPDGAVPGTTRAPPSLGAPNSSTPANRAGAARRRFQLNAFSPDFTVSLFTVSPLVANERTTLFFASRNSNNSVLAVSGAAAKRKLITAPYGGFLPALRGVPNPPPPASTAARGAYRCIAAFSMASAR